MSLTARPTPGGRAGRSDNGISSPFGYSPGYNGGKTFHHGQDYYWLNADSAGSRKVLAAGAGKVIEVFWSNTMGGIITVDHGDFWSRYNHMPRGSSTVSVGDKVTDQTLLGPMGNAGTEAKGEFHLHFEVWVRGSRVDPEPYFNAFTPKARLKEDVKRVAAYLNGRNLGKTSSADQDGVPGSNLYWMIQTAGNADGLYPVPPYVIDGKTGPRTELVFDHYTELTRAMPPAAEPEPAPEPTPPAEPEPIEPEPVDPTPDPVEPPIEEPPVEDPGEVPADEDPAQPSKPPAVQPGDWVGLIVTGVVIVGTAITGLLSWLGWW